MKKSMYWMLTAILVCSLTAAVFSSCSKSDDDGGVTSYSMGFSTMETHTLDALTEMSTIQRLLRLMVSNSQVSKVVLSFIQVANPTSKLPVRKLKHH
jgi:hypothetical protein